MARAKAAKAVKSARAAKPAASRPLDAYNAKRDFTRTAEPAGEAAAETGSRFVVQHHWARRDHYDFRLEMGGVLKSWAVTRGPSAKPATKRLAVRTEDHPVSYATFEGVIPEGQYGGGTVQLWDQGPFDALDPDPLAAIDKGVVKIRLHGERMKGLWALIRLKNDEKRENWLLIKDRDEHAEKDDTLAERYTKSVETGRTRDEITKGLKPKKKSPSGDAPAKASARRASRNPSSNGPAPAFTPPSLCDTRTSAPEGDDWLHEMKYDGYRLQLILHGGEARLYTREGHDWTDRFASLARAAETLDIGDAVIDGEAVVFDKQGLSDFPALVHALKVTHEGFALAAFDLLFLDGEDLRKKPLLERKDRLRPLLRKAPAEIRYAEHVQGGGPAFFKAAVDGGAEGIVSKRADGPYRSGRTPSWVKVKSRKREDVTVVGWMTSDRGRVFASLVVAREEKGKLFYAGRIGTGYDADTQAMLMKILKPLARKTPPDIGRLDLAPRGVNWVEPGLIVEAAMAGWTGDGQVRQGGYLGVREDRTKELAAAAKKTGGKLAKDVAKKTAAKVPAPQSPSNPDAKPDLGRITHPERVMYPKVGVTKRDIADYLVAVAPRLMPHLRDRPVSFVRAPEGVEGETFFQRHPLRGMSRGLTPVTLSRERQQYLTIDSVEGLVTCAQFGVLEIHGWGGKASDIETPDRIVFDLDPDEGLTFETVKDGAFRIRDHLKAAGLKSYPMVSGGKGVHVLVPLAPERAWPQVEAFAEGFARALAREAPDFWVAVMTKSKRKGKIFLDYLRNKRTATAIQPWSLRARAGASVAVPVSWNELKTLDRADAFTMADALKRTRDPWKDFFTLEQTIPDELLKVVTGKK